MEGERRDFDRGAASWDEKPERVRLARDIAEAIVLRAEPHAGMDVLDFGCGTGLLTLRLRPLVRSITGADSSRGMLAVLEKKIASEGLRNVRSLFLDLDRGEALEGSYDMVVSTMTLHHVKEIAPLLLSFRRVLKPGGLLCIADLDPDGGLFHDDTTGVFHRGFDRGGLRSLLAAAGFERIRDFAAAEMEKTSARGETRRFTVFLMTAMRGSGEAPAAP